MITVLVTGIGAIIGYGIINSLRQSSIPVRIVGMDIYDNNYGRHLVDAFYQAKKAYSDEYEDFILQLVQKESVDLIIPGIEQDMYRLFELRDKIPTTIVLNNELLTKLSKDKWQTYEYFKNNSDINLIPSAIDKKYEECVSLFGSPFLMKPRTSYASKGLHIIDNKQDFDFYDSQNNHQNIYQTIVGTTEEEYTVGVFGDGKGGYFDSIILRRMLAQTGATDKAEVVIENRQILDYVDSICKVTKPIGPTCIQLRKDEKQVYLLEINPRISSSCSIRCAAGFNEADMCLKYYLLHEPIVPQEKRPIKAVRYVADCIYE